MATPTKQETQAMLDMLKNRLRQDTLNMTEAARDRVMNYTHDLLQIHQQNMLRKGEEATSQIQRRITSLEYRISSLEQELRITRQLLERLAGPDRSFNGQSYSAL